MKEYRLDKTAFKRQSLLEADNNLDYWRSKSPEERLQAAWYLTCSAYGIPFDNTRRMDKTYFTKRRRS
ncbi:hypothetical protein ACFLU5_18045 [Bacteroidota bacterium]